MTVKENPVSLPDDDTFSVVALVQAVKRSLWLVALTTVIGAAAGMWSSSMRSNAWVADSVGFAVDVGGLYRYDEGGAEVFEAFMPIPEVMERMSTIYLPQVARRLDLPAGSVWGNSSVWMTPSILQVRVVCSRKVSGQCLAVGDDLLAMILKEQGEVFSRRERSLRIVLQQQEARVANLLEGVAERELALLAKAPEDLRPVLAGALSVSRVNMLEAQTAATALTKSLERLRMGVETLRPTQAGPVNAKAPPILPSAAIVVFTAMGLAFGIVLAILMAAYRVGRAQALARAAGRAAQS